MPLSRAIQCGEHYKIHVENTKEEIADSAYKGLKKKRLDICAKLNNCAQSEFTMIESYIYTLTLPLMGGAY